MWWHWRLGPDRNVIRELTFIGCLMVTLTFVGVTMVETMQLHSLGKVSADILTPVRYWAPSNSVVRRCQSYYNSDHKMWAECMGVGYKRRK